MKYFKYALCMMMGAGITILVQTYENEIKCLCQKISKKEMFENGLKKE